MKQTKQQQRPKTTSSTTSCSGVPTLSGWFQGDGYQERRGRECMITLEPRPAYCDRGNFVAKMFPNGALVREIDYQDGWPRYYFDEARAKAEIEAWLRKRGQL